VESIDVLVVGAGPAGSTAAYRLAGSGARVLLVDKARFPRDKACGGGLTARALRHLPVSVDAVVEEEVDIVEVGLRHRRRFERRSAEPLFLMTQRRRLDQHLVERAVEAGAELRDGARVDGIELHEKHVAARVAGTPVRAAALVAADGANGTTARAVGLDVGPINGVAYEGNIGYGAASHPRHARRLVIEVGTVPGGYGWVFPKGDHVNVGVGGWQTEGPRLREHLRRLLAAHGLPESALRDLRGHRLPLRRPGSPLARGRALLVGDAAGLVDPLSGDGMYEAFVSSRLAADAIGDLLAGRAATLEPYVGALIRALGPMVSASWGAKLALDRFPGGTFAVARAPLVWGVLQQLLRGDMARPGEARGAARAPLKLLEALARRAGDPGRAYKTALAETG
jgi:geranylgeranyl reductase family protein